MESTDCGPACLQMVCAFMENSPFSISFVPFLDGCFLLIITLVKIFKP